jgi:hypothetical protein
MGLLFLLLLTLLFYITIILDIGRVRNEGSIERCPSNHPASMRCQSSVQKNIPSKLEVYVIGLHRLSTLQWQLKAKKYTMRA